MAKKGKKSIDEINRSDPLISEALGPLENFEIESLNADSLDIEELEARLEMATSIGDLAVYCGADCGTFCGIDDCTNLCVNNCSSLCAANCPSLCTGNTCGVNDPL